MAKGIQAWAPKKGNKKLAKKTAPKKSGGTEKSLGGVGHVLLTGLGSVGLSLATKKVGSIPTPLGAVKPDIAALIASGAVAFIGKGKKARVAKSLALGAAIAVGNRWATEGSAPLATGAQKTEKGEKVREAIKNEVAKETADLRAEVAEMKEMLRSVLESNAAAKAPEEERKAA